jgi:hypothetical protein
MAWARYELPTLRGALGNVPVTVSVTGEPTSLSELKTALGPDQPDFYDVHYYDAATDAYMQLAQDKSIASPLPLFVGETGESTLPVGGESISQAEAAQNYYLASVESATQALALPAAAPWIFQDFTATGIPWSTDPAEYDFGLLRTDGTEKPAAATIQSFFGAGVLPSILNGNFTEGESGQPLYWSVANGSDGDLAWDVGTSEESGGDSNAVQLSDTNDVDSEIPYYYQTPVIIPTQTDRSLSVSVWAKGLNSTGNNGVAIDWIDSSGNYMGQSRSPLLASGTSIWSQLSETATAPSGATSEKIVLYSSGNSGTVWYSNVQVSAN